MEGVKSVGLISDHTPQYVHHVGQIVGLHEEKVPANIGHTTETEKSVSNLIKGNVI